MKKRPLDPIFQLLADYRDDERASKVNLGIGLYFNGDGSPFVFESVKRAFAELDADNLYYQPIGGNREFLDLVAEFLFGSSDNLAMAATCGGTQACSIFSNLVKGGRILIGAPSWGNYEAVFSGHKLEYFDHLKDGVVNFEGYMEAAKSANAGDVMLLQGGQTHNPCGVNLDLPQMKKMIKVLNERKTMIFIDSAYLGLGEGLDEDKAYLQLAREEADNFALAFSFSKSASLYELRTGVLMVKTSNAEAVESQMQQLLRESVSMAPGLGQELMINILSKRRNEWEVEMEAVREELNERRGRFKEVVGSIVPDSYGMFALLDLSEKEIELLRAELGIYMLGNGRVNFGSLRQGDYEILKRFRKTLEKV